MNFLKNLFKADDHREKLEKILKGLLKPATKIVLEPGDPEPNSHLQSHFGGEPYFEKGHHWPGNQDKEPMTFVFQIFNDGKMRLPRKIKLLQFFYDFEESPWTTEDSGWFVKIYDTLDPSKIKIRTGMKPKKPLTTATSGLRKFYRYRIGKGLIFGVLRRLKFVLKLIQMNLGKPMMRLYVN